MFYYNELCLQIQKSYYVMLIRKKIFLKVFLLIEWFTLNIIKHLLKERDILNSFKTIQDLK